MYDVDYVNIGIIPVFFPSQMGFQGNVALHVVMATGRHPELNPTRAYWHCRKQDEFDKGSIEVRPK